MIETVGGCYDSREKQNRAMLMQQQKPSLPSQAADSRALSIPKVMMHLTGLKDSTSPRIRFAIMDLMELKANNWKPKTGKGGPKTQDEIRNEAAREELKKEVERKEVSSFFITNFIFLKIFLNKS